MFIFQSVFFCVVSVKALVQTTNVPYDCSVGCPLDLTLDVHVVCGTDGNHYYNECIAICQGVTLSEDVGCAQHHRRRLQSVSTVTTGFIPSSVMNRFPDFQFVRKVDLTKLSQGPTKRNVNVNNFKKDSRFKTESEFDAQPALLLTSDGYEFIGKTTQEEEHPESELEVEGLDSKRNVEPKPGNRRLDVFGRDDRTLIPSPWDYPYRTIGRLSYANGFSCTATAVSANSTLTAASCLYDVDVPDWIRPEGFSPGLYNDNGNPEEPYGKWKWGTLIVSTGYSRGDGDLQYDYGIAQFHNNSEGLSFANTIGYTGLAESTKYTSLNLTMSTITGYPRDKGNYEMWTAGVCPGGFEVVDEEDSKNLVAHFCDTDGGMMGSALLDPYNYVRGLHMCELDEESLGLVFFPQTPMFFDVRRWSGRIPRNTPGPTSMPSKRPTTPAPTRAPTSKPTSRCKRKNLPCIRKNECCSRNCVAVSTRTTGPPKKVCKPRKTKLA